MLMKFTVEQRHLTDQAGKPVADDPGAVSFHTCEAENVDDAVRLFVSNSRGEVIGETTTACIRCRLALAAARTLCRSRGEGR